MTPVEKWKNLMVTIFVALACIIALAEIFIFGGLALHLWFGITLPGLSAG